MKKHVYFREDLQALRYLPIVEENCYYLGEFDDIVIERIEDYLMATVVSFYELSNSVDSGLFDAMLN